MFPVLEDQNFEIIDKEGKPGADGKNGQDGIDGKDCSNSLISFNSFLPVATVTVLGVLLNTNSVVGPGSSTIGITPLGDINLTGGVRIPFNVAPSISRAGIITNIHAYFSVFTTVGLALSTVTIRAQLWTSSANNFSPFPGTIVNLTPSLTAVKFTIVIY